jgi:glycosyltransferase involved in cell wall biosynthesis
MFTVFTTSYDRAYTLHRAYESLKRQTFRDFEWLIADNGSSDNTQEVVKKWIEEADFPIRLISWKKNVGIHGAINRGVQEARGEFFLGFDSDDECAPNSLEDLKKYWDLIPNDSKKSFSGVTARCVDRNSSLFRSQWGTFRLALSGVKSGENIKHVLSIKFIEPGTLMNPAVKIK